VITGAIKSCKESYSQIVNIKPTCRFLQDGCPSCHPNNNINALKGKSTTFTQSSPDSLSTLGMVAKTLVSSLIPVHQAAPLPRKVCFTGNGLV